MLIENKINFPDEYFPIENNLLEDFTFKVNYGRKYAKKLNMLFCAICKDVEHVIAKTINYVKQTGEMFNNYDIYLYENNSSDKTVEVIESLKDDKIFFKNEYVKDASYTRSNVTLFDRCKHISNARNKYVEFVNENIDKYDYIIVFDTDIEGGWSNDGVLNSIYYLETNNDFGCMSSYCVLASANCGNLEDYDKDQWLMFDSFAFRFYGNWDFPNNIAMHNYIKVKKGQLPMLVNSNFNGLAIYKPICFKDNKYFATNHGSEFSIDCDHVNFHKGIYKKGLKVLLNPSMITSISNHKYSKGMIL